MISNSSIKNFFFMNFILLFIGFLQYFYLSKYSGFFLTFVGFLMRNIVMERGLNFMLMDKEYIDPEYNREQVIIKNYPSIIFHYLTTTTVETLTNIGIYNFYTFGTTNIIIDIIMFIPISFFYEIIFDLFHYLTHRLEHIYPFLYKHFHKVHHFHSYPTTELTYYHHPIDLVLSNTIPQYITLCIVPQISPLMYNFIIVYKIFIELSGHSGKNINSSCFPQFVWVPKLLGIEMYTEDHDAHHKLNNCNYAKRFILWDKLFGTYKKTYTSEKFTKKD
jgi:sterol desaturase/sphingolipid hydroxylase (fatty acid hydroxylase superfamily)